MSDAHFEPGSLAIIHDDANVGRVQIGHVSGTPNNAGQPRRWFWPTGRIVTVISTHRSPYGREPRIVIRNSAGEVGWLSPWELRHL